MSLLEMSDIRELESRTEGSVENIHSSMYGRTVCGDELYVALELGKLWHKGREGVIPEEFRHVG